MSADNYIGIKKRGLNWWVWWGFASEDRPNYRKAKQFETREKAVDYAIELEKELGFVEYGIRFIESED
jgi:hypothetical protein